MNNHLLTLNYLILNVIFKNFLYLCVCLQKLEKASIAQTETNIWKEVMGNMCIHLVISF